MFYSFTDVCESFIIWNHLFARTGNQALSITSQGSIMRCLNIIAMIGSEYGRLNMQYLLVAMISVSLGLAYPQDWPDLFGRWTDAVTVRQFWGLVLK